MMLEVWKDIPGFENAYQISSFGNVRTKHRYVRANKTGTRLIKERLLKPAKLTTNYYQVNLHKNNTGKQISVHRLVAAAFIPNPSNKPQINHIDGNGLNNHVSNLEWCTRSENGLHSYRVLGNVAWHKGKFGKGTPTAKPVLQYKLDGTLVKRWDCGLDAVREAGFDSSCISRVAQGVSKTHKGFRWQYAD